MVVTTLDWSDAAACRDSDAALFYPADTAERREERAVREQMAKRICAGCSVREACLHASIARHETYGIWGGLNEIERRALLRA